MQEAAIQRQDHTRSGDNQDQANLSHEDNPCLDADMNGDMPSSQWQVLREVFDSDKDLASIFQGDLALRGSAAGLNDWMKISRSGEDAAIKNRQESSAPLVSVDEVLSIDAFDDYTISTVSFYLVPRKEDDFILGELSHNLRSWLADICHHYTWQLDFLAVRPNYVRWTLRDFPDILTQEMLQIIRQETSQRVFEQFPQLQRGAQYADYWASGFLMDFVNREFSTQALLAHLGKGSSRMMQSV